MKTLRIIILDAECRVFFVMPSVAVLSLTFFVVMLKCFYTGCRVTTNREVSSVNIILDGTMYPG